ncbi:NAD(P)/FAD-dependent oxidoreductase [Streptomyces sp. NPDC017993]|uniref:NAD(P)/FAD-dependent oxidoreductase n=1 Tax=Streptomyces sp. NPDC017993 TaxID=3365027 RepID=UPI0037A4AA27
MRQRSVAVIGSGVAGLTAAYVLSTARDVTLYEADGRLGGHAHTHDVPTPDGRVVPVDSGFIVHNRRTYPHLLRLFDELDVPTQESEMSMSVRCEGCGLEYAGARGLAGLFARPDNALRPRYLRMLTEIVAFRRAARALLATGAADAPSGTGGRDAASEPHEDPEPTLGAFLRRGRFSPYFTAHFMTPLVSAVWSCGPSTALRYPARYLFRFLDHHGMLAVGGSPTWRTVTGGSRTYVDRVAKQLHAVRTGTPVRAVRRVAADGGGAAGVEVTAENGSVDRHEAVVIAVHPDQALRLLADATDAEREALGAFTYSRNPTLLHTDTAPLPRRRGAAASWNYLMPSCSADAGQVLVSYHMNRLQRLEAAEEYVVTLNAAERVDPAKVLARMVYEHPVFTPQSVAAQARLPALDDTVTAFAGAYHGWGFHEDGARSGVSAAARLGVRW